MQTCTYGFITDRLPLKQVATLVATSEDHLNWFRLYPRESSEVKWGKEGPAASLLLEGSRLGEAWFTVFTGSKGQI